jgi:demethoxyubiquinone hydroxylase (CLK1/Coq7/Cat5 family)
MTAQGLEVQLSAAKVALSAFSSDEQRRNEKIVASERRLSEIQELTENLLLRSDAARERMAAYINKGRVSRLHFDVLRLWQRHAWLVKRVHLAREKRSDRLLRRAFGELSIQGWMDQSFQYMQHLENDVSSTV